jgi:hypothetical protein
VSRDGAAAAVHPGRYFYRPLSVAVLVVSRWARRLQSGRLDAYMAYMLIAVLAVLAVVIATA